MTKDDLDPIGMIDSANAYIKQIEMLEQENKALYEENQRLYKENSFNAKNILKRLMRKLTRKVKKVK